MLRSASLPASAMRACPCFTSSCCRPPSHAPTSSFTLLRYSSSQAHQRLRSSPRGSFDETKIHHSYHVLKVGVGSDAARIRERYFELAKKLHPDVVQGQQANKKKKEGDGKEGGRENGGSSVDPDTAGLNFQHVHDAYTYLMSMHADTLSYVAEKAALHAREGGHAPSSSSGHPSGPVPNAAHANTIAHRTYLRNEGVGVGMNPAVRDKQYRAHRLSRGVSGAMDYLAEQWTQQAEAEAAEKGGNPSDKDLAHFDSLLSLTRSGGGKHISSVTLIEEQIKAAISNWDPRELKDFGKPLEHLMQDSGATQDPLEAKLNQILLRNGVLPDWIQLEKDIVGDYEALVQELKFVWNEFVSEEQFMEGWKKRKVQKAEGKGQSKEHKSTQQAAVDGAASSAATAAASSPSPTAASAPSSSSSSPSAASSPAALSSLPESDFGPAWSLAISEFHSGLKSVNSAVDKLNLLVPSMSRQRVHFSAAGVVEGIELQPPDKKLSGSGKVRERLAMFRRGNNSGGRSRIHQSRSTATNKIATSINGDTQGSPLNWKSVSEPDQPRTVSELLHTSDLNEAEMEALYRSLSVSEKQQLEQEEARKRRLKASTSLPPSVVAALVTSSAVVLALPVWLVKRQKHEHEEGAQVEQRS